MKKSGKTLTAVIAFILGLLFTLIVEVSAVFGVYIYVMHKDLNTVMASIGIPNTDDRFVNTDKNNGGVSNLKELISGMKGLVYEGGEIVALGKSFDDFKELVPATQVLLNAVYGVIDGYIDLDKQEFESKPLTELAQVLSDSVMNVKTMALMEKLGMDNITGEEANPVVKSIVVGTETDYATVHYSDGREDTGLKLPVLYDCYMEYGGSFDRIDYLGYARPVNGASALPYNLSEDLLCQSGIIDDGVESYHRYMLYFVPCKVTENGIEEADYSMGECTVTDGDKTYNFQIVEFGEDTDFIAVKPVGGKYEIDFDAVYAAINDESTSLSDRFSGYSYSQEYARGYYFTKKNAQTEKYELQTISGKNYFRNSLGKAVQLDALTLTDIVLDAFAPLNSVLVTDVIGEGDSTVNQIFGSTTLGALLRGEVDAQQLAGELAIDAFIDIKADEALSAYLGYGVKRLKAAAGADYNYTGKISVGGVDTDCYLSAEDGVVKLVWYFDDGQKKSVFAAKMSELPARIQSFANDMTVGDIIAVGETAPKFLKAVASTPIGNLENKISDMTVGEMFEESELNGSALLRKLKSAKISGLAAAVDGLLIQEVYASRIYDVADGANPELATEYKEDLLYYVIENDEFVLAPINEASGHVTAEQFEAGEYYTYGEAQGMWRLVLYKDGVEKAYAMNDLDNMVASCAATLYKAKLGQLQAAGIIGADKDLSGTLTIDGQTKTVAEFTLEDVIWFVIDQSTPAG